MGEGGRRKVEALECAIMEVAVVYLFFNINKELGEG